MSEMTPAELDRWLAEHVMGWRLDELTWFDADGGGHYDAEHVDAYDCGTCCVWHPTSNIAQAIEAAEKARADGRIGSWALLSPWTMHPDTWLVEITRGLDGDSDASADTAPLALCRALHAALT